MSQSPFQFFKGSVAVVCKVEVGVFSCQANQRFGNSSVVLNKTLIEVTEPKKGLDAFDSSGSFLVMDHRDLVRVDFNIISGHNKAQVFGLFDAKFVFLNISL